jgi:hypothetical protein
MSERCKDESSYNVIKSLKLKQKENPSSYGKDEHKKKKKFQI